MIDSIMTNNSLLKQTHTFKATPGPNQSQQSVSAIRSFQPLSKLKGGSVNLNFSSGVIKASHVTI
jgi:hypothetical protein